MHRSVIVTRPHCRASRRAMRCRRIQLKRTRIGDTRFSLYRRKRLVVVRNDTEFDLLPHRNILNELYEKYGHIKIPVAWDHRARKERL